MCIRDRPTCASVSQAGGSGMINRCSHLLTCADARGQEGESDMINKSAGTPAFTAPEACVEGDFSGRVWPRPLSLIHISEPTRPRLI
eukprot:3621341-Rhodomonas_salina.1